MTQNYIGVNGLVTQDMASINSDLTSRFLDIYSLANIEQNSPDGQWINILSQEKKDSLDLFTTYYNNLDVDRAVGIPQQILYKLNGLTINAYTFSYVYVTVVINSDVTLQGLDGNIENPEGIGYTVKDSNGNRWILAETQELSPGSYTLNFRSAELGAITALANTITIMETVLPGVVSVNNPAANYITGNQGETAAQFRRRRNRAMAVPSQGFDESIESQMLNLSDVTQCKVYSNRNSSTVDGIPAH
ncbi:MAG: baseplate J/gp47 family protein, partial [Clostridia bacterium]|nr:baseplate J/gp47 family protein [Clostridia bacterium]